MPIEYVKRPMRRYSETEKIGKTSTYRKFWMRIVRKMFNERQLRQKIQVLEKHCALYLDSAIRAANMDVKKAIAVFEQILFLTDRFIFQNIPLHEIDSVVKCSLILVQAYVAHLKIRKRLLYWSDSKFLAAKRCFHNLAYKLLPEYVDQVFTIIMKFLQNEHLWKVEFICSEIIIVMLACEASPDVVLAKMLSYVAERIESDDMTEARHVTRVLHDIMYEQYWVTLQAADMNYLIHMFYTSTKTRTYDNNTFQMCRGFAICLQRLFEIIESVQLVEIIQTMITLTFNTDLPEEAMLAFGSSTEYATVCDKSRKIIILPSIIDPILSSISSNSESRCILACRILSRFIDQHGNYREFNIPQIFFSDTMYNIKISEYHAEDKAALEVHDRHILQALVTAICAHSSNVVCLQAIYNVLCLIIVEIPCGYVAASIIHALMEIQKFALSRNKTDTEQMQQANHLHATIISVISLICWVNRPKTLTQYVNSIVMKRFDEGPHLNPPLKDSYQYAQHHALWNKHDLFFDSWELRYGLWKCFRNDEERLVSIQSTMTKKKIVKLMNDAKQKTDQEQSTNV